jgi:AcrR family transcriptional regulator
VARQGLDRGRVVAAAAELADAEGLQTLTVARLAAQLDVRAPSLYNHLDSREGVVRSVGLLGLDELGDALSAATVGRSGGEALTAFAKAYRDYARAHPGRYAAGAVRAGDKDDDEWTDVAARVTEIVFAILRAWDLEGDEAVHAARAIRSALHGFIDLEAAGGFGIPVDLDESYERLVQTLIAGLEA